MANVPISVTTNMNNIIEHNGIKAIVEAPSIRGKAIRALPKNGLIPQFIQSLFHNVNCNPDQAMLAAMAALGSGFECASRAEIESIIALGVSPDRIIFANPCKPEPDIEYAASVALT